MTPALPPEDTSALINGRGRRGTLTARFLQAVGREVGADGLTPAALSRAVVQVLPVEGAGMSILTGALRMPLGWSSAAVKGAEELQTTLGEGPCLTAVQMQTSVVFDADDLAERWSLYSKELIGKTPFRAVAAIPLRVPGQGVFAALDLFTHDPKLAGRVDLADIDQHVAAPAAALLTICIDEIVDPEHPQGRPEWYQTAAGRRHDVWVAIGMVMAHRPGLTRDALSLMRAHAYSHDRSLDDLAADIVARRLPPTDITG